MRSAMREVVGPESTSGGSRIVTSGLSGAPESHKSVSDKTTHAC